MSRWGLGLSVQHFATWEKKLRIKESRFHRPSRVELFVGELVLPLVPSAREL